MAYYLLHNNQPSAKRLIAHVPELTRYVASNRVTDRDVLLRWGAVDESDPVQGAVLNSKDAIARVASRAQMAKFLRRVGVRVAARTNREGMPASFGRQYRIPLFDFEPLGCFRSDSGVNWTQTRISRIHASFDEISLDADNQTKRATYLATRTMHALGLDFGLVSIGVSDKGLLQVLDVSATPILEGRLLELYRDAITRFVEREEQARRGGTTNLVLGTDVEVMLRNAQGKMVLASNYFPRRGRIGCDDRSVNFDGKRLPLMELRPAPDSHPNGLILNLRATMREASEKINRANVEWRAGSMPFRPYCTGGHIHFSGVPLSSRLVKALDHYVGLPLMAVEDRTRAGWRRPKYGFLGDVRRKDYGGFEYRTPASFVCSQTATVAAYHLAHMVALHYRDLPLFDLYSTQTQVAFYNGQLQTLRPLILRNIEALRMHSAYAQYREYVEPLFAMVEAGQTWDETRDVRREWDVPLVRTTPAKRRLRKVR
ncbi:Phage phiEco32-like COOH.NH2 ligase-type 2 [Alicyclobacillus hesperidum]|uniref:Phage phiEco32-like COOH.NH2 ligase-type 2 n=1 Tax=Alicyclobacillus hesperidum TaxID=89784 RepID=A0A1H2SNA9_9BACL|nr:hypothetical protein [Alicyclobacillus hesperidum]SDW32529.1 Phage phiEco32-like COOH.NH2 ligase-type 2 [Alicyclobacillus hesperidum]